MTELSFLVDLLLGHKLPKVTREAVAARIKEVETRLTPQRIEIPMTSGITAAMVGSPVRPRKPANAQSPSTQAILAEKFTPDEIEKMAGGEAIEPTPIPETQSALPPPAQSVPVTPAAAQALQQRQNAIMRAVNSGPFGAKPDEGRTSPRKF
jgi:hypothetical protein